MREYYALKYSIHCLDTPTYMDEIRGEMFYE